MNKKKILLLSTSAILMLGAIGSTAYALGGNIPLSLFALDHETTHHMSEHAFIAPTTSTDGYTNYWRCDDCCKVSADSARYDFYDKTKLLTEEQVTLPKLTAATQEDIDASSVNTINNAKFKNLDQTAALFVKDEGKTAVFASKSNVTGDPINATDNTGASEFRFTVPEANRTTGSVTFSYKYLDYGKGLWQGGDYAHQIENGHIMVQFKDNGAYIPLSLDKKLTNDYKWHTIRISYGDFLGGAASTTSFTDFIIKIVDFRGCLMIADINYESTVSVTLKNAKTDGSDVVETISKGTLPATTPDTISGKTFLGWFDEAGNKVTEVTSNCTLIAHYGFEKIDTNNEMLMAMPYEDSAYGKPESAVEKWPARTKGDHFGYDTESNSVSPEEGCHDFLVTSGFTGVVGLTLPAFNFSTSGSVFFTFGFQAGIKEADNRWIALNGNILGDDGADQATGIKFKNYTATIKGKNVVVSNYFKNTKVEFTLDDETYNGQKGLEITGNNMPYYFLSINPFRSLNFDYFGGGLKIENALPDTPVTGYEEQIKAYQEYRAYFSEVENTLYPVSSKMQSWLDTIPQKILTFGNNLENVKAVGNTGQINKNSDDLTAIKTNQTPLYGGNAAFPYGTDYLLIKITGKLDETQWADWVALTFPAINYSEYAKVEFSFGTGGNGSGINPSRFYFGEPTEKYSKNWESNPNFIGSYDCSGGWSSTLNISATIENGKILFKHKVKGNINKEIVLSENIYTGKEGLTITFGNVAWDAFVMSPFQAIKTVL